MVKEKNKRFVDKIEKKVDKNIANMKDTEDNVREKISEMKGKMDDLQDEFETKIQDNPMKSVGIALGAGILIGALTTAIIKK